MPRHLFTFNYTLFSSFILRRYPHQSKVMFNNVSIDFCNYERSSARKFMGKSISHMHFCVTSSKGQWLLLLFIDLWRKGNAQLKTQWGAHMVNDKRLRFALIRSTRSEKALIVKNYVRTKTTMRLRKESRVRTQGIPHTRTHVSTHTIHVAKLDVCYVRIGSNGIRDLKITRGCRYYTGK